jgi:spore coat protein CotH
MIRMILLVVLLAPARARAQSSDEFFDGRTLHEIRLYVHSSDLAELRARYLEDVYVPADFEWRGVRVRNVGVRVRGLATRSAIKPGLRIDFNRFTAEQAFLGM